MASATLGSPTSETELNEIIKLMWGSEVKEDVFQRWKQGFRFSNDEPTALLQYEGGPCAVLAPVQAFILRSIVNDVKSNWHELESEAAGKILVRALCEILEQANEGNKYFLVLMKDENDKDVKIDKKTHSYFHSHLRLISFENAEEVEAFYLDRIETLRETFGVLLFLYSVMCTKGLEKLYNEVTDPSETFIDSEFGYGSQSLINLMITGRAVAHVWNFDQDICGLKLKGIDKQSKIGFLTLLEHLRYCEVGSFLKNPIDPVWVLGSETHLTVLFSFERRLVGKETPSEIARRVFKSFDPEGNNFIAADSLQEVLNQLELVSEPEYVDIMKKKLDAENLGIILLSSFMDEFFPEESVSIPDTFNVYHYNGLLRSSLNNKVVFQEGTAVLLETNMCSVLESNNMLTCLQTKWPYVEIQWLSGITPSLN